MANKQEIERLVEIKGKHTQYQDLAIDSINEFNVSKLNAGKYSDEERLNWLFNNFESDTPFKNVTDIGANLGYFSFKLKEKFDLNISIYEPFKPQTDAITIMKKQKKYTDEEFKIINKGIALKDIDSLEKTDLVILLNVLQHAGEDFDSQLVQNIEDWYKYAVNYLSEIRKKTSYLFYQQGYSWKGHEGCLCEDSKIIDFTAKLLLDAGWKIKNVGLIKNYASDITYSNYMLKSVGSNKVYLPGRRNDLPSRIIRRLKSLIIPTPIMPYRFAQRPLWLCEK